MILTPLLARWYAFGPWVLVLVLIWRQFGWRRALPIAVGGWLIAFGAEWASSAGPVGPFGPYNYQDRGLGHDWRLLGVPLFDSLSFTWLAVCTYVLTGWLGARGARRPILAALAMVAIDLVVDPVALRGASWWLGAIYSYPAGSGLWYGVSALNYLGWFLVGLTLQLWIAFWLGGQRQRVSLLGQVAALVVAGVMVQSAALAVLVGVGPSALAAGALLVCLGIAARGLHSPAPATGGGGRPPAVIACALSSEAEAVRRALGSGWVAQLRDEYTRWTRSRQPTIEIWETGSGLAAAGAAARVAPSGTAVLVAGVGGACSDDWPLGSTAIGSRVLTGANTWLELDPAAHDRLIALGAGRSARLGSLETPVDSERGRARLAGRGVEILEMETAAWLTEREQSPGGVVLALRTVTDTPSAPLGVAAELLVPGATGPSPPRVAWLVLAHPWRVGDLISLGSRQRTALDALGRAVTTCLPLLNELTARSVDHEGAIGAAGSSPARDMNHSG